MWAIFICNLLWHPVEWWVLNLVTVDIWLQHYLKRFFRWLSMDAMEGNFFFSFAISARAKVFKWAEPVLIGLVPSFLPHAQEPVEQLNELTFTKHLRFWQEVESWVGGFWLQTVKGGWNEQQQLKLVKCEHDKNDLVPARKKQDPSKSL